MESSRSAEPPADKLTGLPGAAPDQPAAEPSGSADGSARVLAAAPDLPTLVAFVNAQHGTTFRITDRNLGGEQGAVALSDANSVRFILKWSPGAQDLGRLPEILQIVNRLKSLWYPVPRYVVRGLHPAGRYVVLAGLPGTPARRLSPPVVEQLLALNDRQRDQGFPADEPWPARVVRDTLDGGDDYCLLDPMRQHAPETARLLDLVQSLVAQHRDVPTPTGDIVHFDFQPSNILIQGTKVTGVVDWDGAQTGDRAFDLATLLFYTYDQDQVRESLWTRLTEIADPRAAVLYLAHLIHRQVDWSIRHRPPETVNEWLERARLVLQDIPSRTGITMPPWH
jgi:hypothetical protein